MSNPVGGHTRGPWRVNGCELIGDGTILATLCWHSGREAENAADYHLIAAAPELLSALEAVERQVFCDCPERNGVVGHEPGCFVPLARSALSRARGEG